MMRILTQNTNGDTQTHTYNAFNHLVVVERDGMSAVYTYRADGLRHAKTVNGYTTTHLWDRGSIVLERNAGGAVVNRFRRGLGHLISSDQHGFYLFNVRGDVVQRVDGNGDVIHTYRYDAFGNQLNGDDVNTNPFRFAGEYFNWETVFIYLRARFYNPLLGRFISEDPHWTIRNMQLSDDPRRTNEHLSRYTMAPLQAGNLYVYVMHNPIKFADPSGLNASPSTIVLSRIRAAFGSAAVESTTVEVTTGLGVGGSVKVGPARINIQGTAMHFTYVFSSDGLEDVLAGFGIEASVDVENQIKGKLGVTIFSSAENAQTYGILFAPDREVKCAFAIFWHDGAYWGFTSIQRSSDVIFSVGASGYAVLGGGVRVSFNWSEFQ